MKQSINYKSFQGEIKDVDAKTRTVTMYLSAFGNKDSDGDVIMPGSFSKTIAENGPQGSGRIQHLLQHNTEQPLGKIKELNEDSFGLLCKSQLVPTSYGLDTIKLYEAGVYNEHSVGFNTVKSQDRGSHKELQELKLWEGSTVTWGANASTPVVAMKKLKLSKDQFAEKLDKLMKGIKAGTFTDENIYLLELSFTELKSMYGISWVDQEEEEDTISLNPIPELDDEPLDPLKNSNQAGTPLDPQVVIDAINKLREKIG